MQEIISFIIPTKNEEGYIENCLRSIKNLKTNNTKTEIIVVDSYSTDRTVNIVRKYARVIFEKRKGPGVARNTGAKIAKGDILVFADADVILPSDFLDKLKKNFRKPILGCVFRQETNTGLIEIWNIIIKYLTRIGFTITNGCCFAFDANAFRRVGGFDPDLLTNEDHDLARRVSKLGRFYFMDNIKIFVSSRRLDRGVFNFFKLNLKATFTYFLNHKSCKDYWK